MSIATDKARLEQAKTDIAQAITDKGVTVPSGTKIDGMAALIGTITGGGGIQLPDFTYDGDCYVVNDSDEEWVEGNWKAYLLTSGTFTPNADMALDVFCVGGGASGGGGTKGGGGGGGYTYTEKNVLCAAGTPVAVSIGSGGPRSGSGTSAVKTCQAGGATSFGAVSANGAPATVAEGKGGDGGSGGGGGGTMAAAVQGDGGTNGGDGINSSNNGGVGQGTPTTEFGEEGAIVYSGGGGGGNSNSSGAGGAGGAGGSTSTTNGGGVGGTDPLLGGESAPKAGTSSSQATKCGGGGGGYGGGGGGHGLNTNGSSGAGCQGIVVIRNARALTEG